jgi:subfamily B ATP-binding cassette protein MsbA
MTDDIRAIDGWIFSMLEVVHQRASGQYHPALAWMLMLSLKLTVFVFIMLGVVGVTGSLGKTLKRQSMNIQETIGRFMSIVEESISGLRIVQAFGAERYKMSQFEETNEIHYQQGNKIEPSL